MPNTRAIVALYFLAILSLAAAPTPFTPAPQFNEQTRWFTFDSGVRLYVSAPATFDPAKPNLLVIYATPNGNTIEETLGCAKGAAPNFRFDIQHVAAQIRLLRTLDHDHNIVLAMTQAPQRSWPAFRQERPDAGKIIQAVLDEAARNLPGPAPQILLAAHSGGGSFIFGYLNANPTIPPSITRIAFLDANYSYDDQANHGNKLLAWLRADAARHLVVIAYDDREITFEGKKVVGPTGGTFRATARMTQRFKRDLQLSETDQAPFLHTQALDGQLQFFVHKNPENKILHTALVGEMNSLLQALTLGTPLENTWGKFGGPRAYEKFVSANPTRPPTTQPSIPPRPANAPNGSAFFKQIQTLSPTDRETAILSEIEHGNIPDFLRKLVPITVENTTNGVHHTATYYVMPDYLSIGSDQDFFRLPMTPMTARAIADRFDCALITRKISDDIYQNAQVRLAPLPLTENRESAQTFYQHNQAIEQQRAQSPKPLGALVAGIKKDVVITNRLAEKPHHVAIYGWHKDALHPIQPLTIVHIERYVDYSHGVRLISRHVMVDQHLMDVTQVLRNRDLCALLSDEGPLAIDAYAVGED
jgi:hypothetical protein